MVNFELVGGKSRTSDRENPRLPPPYKYHPDYDRLRKLGLTTLETRRLRGDSIEVFENFKGFENVSLATILTLL